MKKTLAGIFVVILTGGPLFIWTGIYNVAATDKHWAITNELLELVRERSIEVRSEGIAVPNNLDDPERISSAAANYEEMCSACHLTPGVVATELYEGLYPRPLIFYDPDHETHGDREKFRVIKNGIKLTGMPTWGASHSDDEIWALVVFINRLEGMSAEEYQRLIADGKT